MTIIDGRYYLPHFTDEETEAQWGLNDLPVVTPLSSKARIYIYIFLAHCCSASEILVP